MPNVFDQFDPTSELKDLATSFGVGSNQLLKMGGDAYGLATGNMGNAVSRLGQENIDYLQRGKSKNLTDAETRRNAAVDAKKGIVDQALAYAKETFTDPRLLLSSTVEAIPSMIGAGGIGAGARAVTGRVLAKKGVKEAAEIATKVGVGTAVAAGSGMQGTSVGAEQYGEVADILSKMPDEKAMEVPEIARLMSANGYSLEKAKEELTLNLARSTGALAGIASLATQMVPGGRTIEGALVGGAGKKLPLAQRGLGVVRGLLGEPIQEGSEEGSGAAIKNVVARAVDPERDITKGVGAAIGGGVAGTALIGAGAGAGAVSHSPRQSEATVGKPEDLATRDITVLEATTDHPRVSLGQIEDMSPEEFAAAINLRDALSRGGKPSSEDIATVEGMRLPPDTQKVEASVPVQDAINEWVSQNPDAGIKITAINDPNLRNSRNYGIRGYFDPNTGDVVINSAFVKSFDVESIIHHEWAHHTLSSEEGKSAIVDFATRDIPKEELDALAKRYPNADNLTLVEEWIARNQETFPGIFDSIIAKIREWLNGKFGINMTNEEAARAMLRTLRERGAAVAEEGGEMRQSTTEEPDESGLTYDGSRGNSGDRKYTANKLFDFAGENGLYHAGRGLFIGEKVDLELRLGVGREWNLGFIGTKGENRGKGAASDLLSKITNAADSAGIRITLDVDPQGGGLSKKQLISWYERNGFERQPYDAMVREPRQSTTEQPVRESTTEQPISISERRAEALRAFKERNPLSDAVMYKGRLSSPKVRDRLKTLRSTGVVDRQALDSDIETNFPAASRVEIPTEDTLPTLDEIRSAVDEPKRSKVGGAVNIPEGDLIVVRQDVRAHTNSGVGVVTVRDSKGNTYYLPMVRFTDPVLKPTPRQEGIALFIGSGEDKDPAITVKGRMSLDQSMPPDLDTWTQVGYNPDRHSYMYDRETGDPVLSGSEAVQIGNTIFVKDPEFGQKKDFKYSLTDDQIDAVDKRRISELDIDDLVSKGVLTDRHGELLSELRDVSGGDTSIEVASPEDLPRGAAGVYDPNTNRIIISRVATIALGRILMHEYTHALTFMGLKYANDVVRGGDVVSATPRPGVDIRDLREASRQMDNLFSIADKAAKDRGMKFYGLSNRLEFVAEAFSSKIFQDFLSSIPSTKGSKQSLFDQFISIVKKILGTESDSLLTDVIRATDPFVGAKKKIVGTLMISDDGPRLTDDEMRQSTTEDPIRSSGIMASPSITDIDYSRAKRNLTSSDQTRFRSQVKDYAPDAAIYNAVGDWRDGAENSVAAIFDTAMPTADLEQLAAKAGLAGDQKAVLWWTTNPNGADAIHRVTWPKDVTMDQARQAMIDAGLENRTLIETPDGVQGFVFDQGQQNLNKITDLHENPTEPSISTQRATGDFLGSRWDNTTYPRVEGKRAYRAVLGRTAKTETGDRGGQYDQRTGGESEARYSVTDEPIPERASDALKLLDDDDRNMIVDAAKFLARRAEDDALADRLNSVEDVLRLQGEDGLEKAGDAAGIVLSTILDNSKESAQKLTSETETNDANRLRGGRTDAVKKMDAREVQKRSKKLEHTIPDEVIDLVHYSSNGNLSTVDPASLGKGLATRNDLRGLPKSFYFIQGSPLGGDFSLVSGANKTVYKAKVASDRIYDANMDALEYWGVINRYNADEMLVKQGYAGFAVEGDDGRQTVTMYEPLAVNNAGRSGNETRAGESKKTRSKNPIRESLTDDPVERVPEEGDPDYEEPVDTSSVLSAPAKRSERDDLPPTSALNTLYAKDSSIPLPSQGKRTNGQVAAQLREAAREHWGRDLDSSNITPEEIDRVVTNGVEEVLAGLRASNHAGNWYTTAIRKAMAIAGILHPELNDDALAQKAGFKDAHAAEVGLATAMAITSQNLNVQKNTQYANEQFNILKRTGRFDPSKEYGSKLEAVSGNLTLANAMLDRVGWDGMEDFLNREYTVRELNDVASKLLGRKINISGKVDDVVNGSAIFGPKIGGGFFQNLRGNFNPVTVDLWMRRTWGRWTGDVLPDPLDAKRLARMIDGMRESGIPLPEELRSLRTITAKSGRKVSTLSDAAAERVLSNPEAVTAAYDFAAQQDSRWNKIYSEVRQNITPQQAEAVRNGSLSLEKLNRDQQKSIREKKTAWQDLEDRPSISSKEGKLAQEKLFAEMDEAAGRTAILTNEELSDNKPEWAKSSRVIKTLLKPVDVPSDIDRRVIVDVVNRIRNELDRQGVTATNADIQAILWYPEKDLWAKLAGKKESNLKNSYDEEFLKVAQSQGLGERARAAAARVGDAAP